MMKTPKIDFKIVGAILGVLIIAIFLVYAGDYVGIDAEVSTDLIGVFPGLCFIIVGCLILGTFRNEMFILPGFGAIGIGLAILLGEMNTFGIVVDVWITEGYNLIGLQGFSIVMSLILGAIFTMKR